MKLNVVRSSYLVVYLGLLVFQAGLMANAQSMQAGQVTVDMNRIADSSQIELKGLSNWKYDLRKDGDKKVVMRVPALDTPSAVRLRGHSDELIKKVEVNDKAVDGQFEITFHLKNDNVDFFDYLTEDPPKLIVDFFPKDEESKKTVADTKAAKPQAKVGLAKPKALPAKQGGNVAERAPANEFIKGSVGVASKGDESVDFGGDGVGSAKDFKHGAFDGGDPTFKRFSMTDYEIDEKALIASRGNIYLRFPALKLESPHLSTLLKNPPIYEIVPKSSNETKEAQLLLTLFNNKRRGVFIKTAKAFLKKYPATQYEEIVRYMMADTYYQIWRDERKPGEDEKPGDFEMAMGMYRHLSEKFPDSPLSTRTLLVTGYSFLERGDNFGALKALQHFLRARVGTKFTDQVKISIAEAYLNLNRFEDAFNQLDEVEKTARNRKDAAEAAFRKGDVAFLQKDFEGAIKSYNQAIKKYPESVNSFANAHYNTGEAQFWLGQYRESLDSYRDFVRRFPEHQHGGYAMTRIGELLEIMGADEKRATGAFLEGYFRHRDTPGANIARIRTLISRFPEMKDKEFKSSMREIDELMAKTKLPGVSEFVALMVADGHFRRGDFKTSTDQLVSYYQQNPNAANRDKFQSRIVRNITASIAEQIEAGNFIEALRINSLYSQTWLKNSDRIDTRFYVGKGFEQAGVYKEAGKVYRDTLNKLYSIRGTKKERERGAFEVLPEADSLNLRLAIVAAREKDFSRSADYLKALSNPSKLKGKEVIERAEVSADVSEARGELDSAKRYLQELVDTWKGQPQAVSGVYLRLAKLHQQSKQYDAADAALTKIVDMQRDTNLVPEDTYAATLEIKGDVLLARGRRNESVQAFKELLDGFSGKRPLGSVRYKAGKILFEDGDLKGAEKLWADLKDDKNDLWHKLAQEQLSGAKWRGDYKKYIDRIPAMETMQRE